MLNNTTNHTVTMLNNASNAAKQLSSVIADCNNNTHALDIVNVMLAISDGELYNIVSTNVKYNVYSAIVIGYTKTSVEEFEDALAIVSTNIKGIKELAFLTLVMRCSYAAEHGFTA